MPLIKKISTRTVFGTKLMVQQLILPEANHNENQFLYRVYGQAKGYVSGSSKFQDRDEPSGWTALAGEFEAINRDGELFNAAICFLPAYVTGPIVEALKEEGNTGVEFGFDIFARYDEKAATSYIYLCEPLRKEGDKSPLEEMRKGYKPLPGSQQHKAITDESSKGKKK